VNAEAVVTAPDEAAGGHEGAVTVPGRPGPGPHRRRAAVLRRRLREIEDDPVLQPLAVALRRRVCELELTARVLDD
jgi:hypothetical protein